MSKYKISLTVFVLLVAAYAALTMLLPINEATKAQYQLTDLQLRLLSLTVVLPYIIIWGAAYYGYVKICDYTKALGDGKERPAFDVISKALLILAIGSPLIVGFRAVINYYARVNPEFLPTSVITGNYLMLLLSLLSFTLLYQGAKKLVESIKDSPKLPHYIAFLIGFSVLSASYLFAVLSNPTRTVAGNDAARAIYYLPDWLLIATIVLPYLYTWFLGFVAAMYIYTYQKSVTGILYKKALLYLTIGLVIIIAASIFGQFLTAILNVILNLRLSGLLGVVYAILLVTGIGYVLTALGARRLQKIEEI